MKRYWVSVHSNAPVFNMTDRDVAHTFGPFAGLEELARFEKSRPDSCYKGILPLYMTPTWAIAQEVPVFEGLDELLDSLRGDDA